MKFEPLAIAGSFLVKPELRPDERGFFARTLCAQTFAARGLKVSIRQCSVSFNVHKHTLRGMHYQAAPHEETKIVRCTQGAAYHVVLDLRGDSDTYLRWAATELNSDNRHTLYVPEGVAHGFITLADATEIFYEISEDYSAESASGVRWDDPSFDIDWPARPAVISERDSGYPDYPVQP